MARAHTFAAIADALAAGYRRPDGSDRDVSGPCSYGYRFEDEDGRRTVTVRFTVQRNTLGQPGCYLAMFPPEVE